MTVFDKTRLPHSSSFMTLKDTITQYRSMLSLSNFDLLLLNALKELCENCKPTAYSVVKFQAVKFKELYVCESLV